MLKVKKSKIKGAGLGLFTTSKIRKGDVIVEYEGENMTWAQACKRYKKDINKAKYIFYVSKKNVVDAQNTPWALARYANDAEGWIKIKGMKNNAEYAVIKKKPYIVATRKIKAGEEIFVDYQKEYWEAAEEE